jgi:hypothetical protein
MKAIRSVKVATEKYFRNSIRAYFEREVGCDLRWIAEILRSSPVQARSILETRSLNMRIRGPLPFEAQGKRKAGTP